MLASFPRSIIITLSEHLRPACLSVIRAVAFTTRICISHLSCHIYCVQLLIHFTCSCSCLLPLPSIASNVCLFSSLISLPFFPPRSIRALFSCTIPSLSQLLATEGIECKAALIGAGKLVISTEDEEDMKRIKSFLMSRTEVAQVDWTMSGFAGTDPQTLKRMEAQVEEANRREKQSKKDKKDKKKKKKKDRKARKERQKQEQQQAAAQLVEQIEKEVEAEKQQQKEQDSEDKVSEQGSAEQQNQQAKEDL